MARELNADALTGLAQHVTVAFRLQSELAELVTGSQEAIIQSRVLMTKVDTEAARVLIGA